MIKLTEILLDLLAEKKLCKKGRAYYDRRRAAGEKPSAYLSGRAVKVCKGLMEGDEETIECKNCGWKWDLVDGGKDPFVCHKCGNDNSLDEGKYDDTGEGAGYDLVKQNPFNIQKLVDKGIIFVSKPGDGKGGIEENPWEGGASIITLKNLEKPDPWMKISITDPMPQSIPYIQKDQDKLVYDGKYNQILWGIEQKGLKPEDFYLNVNESLHDWFKKEDWVRIDTAGNITGPCGTMKKGNKTTRCLPRAKANSLTKAERAATSKKKAVSDKQFVSNTKKAKVKLRESNSQIKSELKDVLGEVDEYDVDNEQDIKEFVQFMLEYKETLSESEYQGRKVQLGKPMRGDIKKFKVYVKNPAGNVVKVNFGHGGTSAASKGEKTMRIRKSNPTRRKSFRARHNCDTPGPRTKARYWSCRKW